MSPENEQSTTDLAHQIAEFYADDHPNPQTLQQELHVWKCKRKSFSAERPSSLSKSLFHANETMFPNICQLLRIVSTLPVTSCECERSISVLRRPKTYLRTTLAEERLTGLALVHVNYGMDLNLDEIINIFSTQHPSRMLLQAVADLG